MIILILLAQVLTTQPGQRVVSGRCLATVFGQPGDKLAGQHFACTRELIRAHPERMGIAHRWLPCGTTVRIGYKGRSVVATVVDRGPYFAHPIGCNYRNAKAWKKCRRVMLKWQPGWQYRACIDMLPAVAKALGHKGWGVVTLEWASPPRWEKRKR